MADESGLSGALRVLDHLGDAVVAADAAGVLVYANVQAGRLLGYAPLAMRGLALAELVPERLRPAHAAGFARYHAGAAPRIMSQPVRVPALHASGHEVDVELTLSALALPGHPRLVAASLRDLRGRIELERQLSTQRRTLAQQAVAAALAGHRRFASAAPDLMAALAEPLQAEAVVFWAWSRRASALRCYAAWAAPRPGPRAFVAGCRAARDASFGDAAARAWAGVGPAFQSPAPGAGGAGRHGMRDSWLLPVHHEGRRLGVIEAAAAVLPPPDAELAAAMAAACYQVGLFIARQQAQGRLRRARRRATAARRRRHQEARLLADASVKLSESLDLAAVLVAVGALRQPARAAWLGVYLREDGPAGPALRLALSVGALGLAAPAAPGPARPWAQAAADGPAATVRNRAPVLYRHLTPEMCRGWPDLLGMLAPAPHGLASAVLVPLEARGQVVGCMALGRDASQHPCGRRALRWAVALATHVAFAIDNARLYGDAQKAIHAREGFLAVASHELKTPLTTLQLQIQGLQRRARTTEMAPTIGDKLPLLATQVSRLGALIDRMLDLTRLVHGRLDVQPDLVDAAALLQALVGRARAEDASDGSAIELDAPNTLVGFWDGVRLEQVLANLLSNAQKFGRGLPIRITARDRDGWMEVQVRDAGVGISAADQARVFGRFERAVSRRKYGGLGLGLWISQEIAKALGGRISLSSALGRGSVFTLRLPLVEGH